MVASVLEYDENVCLGFSCGKKKSKQRFFLNLSVAAFGRDKFPTADFLWNERKGSGQLAMLVQSS